jgi:hypothetical protein
MLKATLNNSANLSLSNPVEGICEVSIAGGTSGGVGSFRFTSSVFVPALLLLKVILAEGLQNPNKMCLQPFSMDTVSQKMHTVHLHFGIMSQESSVNIM